MFFSFLWGIFAFCKKEVNQYVWLIEVIYYMSYPLCCGCRR